MAVTHYLEITEMANSIDTTANTSKVLIEWYSVQSGDSWNGYTRTAKYYISFNGGSETVYFVDYTLPKNDTTAILNAIITIPHMPDGSGTVKVRTWMDTGISAGVIEKSKTTTLTTISRPSTITSAANKSLGNTCAVTWKPLSNTFRYKLKFTLGEWEHTTEAIHPNRTTSYTYTGYTFPLEAANQIPSAKTGTMTATLYTYSDSAAATQVGSASSKTFTVTIPDNELTKPNITMELSPDTPYTKFASLYLQGKSKVKATFSGSGEYGATIKSYSMQTGGRTYSSPYTSDILSTSGEISVVGTVTDSRGYVNTASQKINVIAYQAPYIAPVAGQTKVICERCTADGIASDSGTYLHIKGTRNYTKINTDGIVNTCSVRCRYKPEGGSWSHDSGAGVGVLLWTDTSTDTFDVVLAGIVEDKLKAYTVELNIIDDTYIPSAILFNIPSENVTIHFREGGNGVAVGKYSQNEKEFECGWNARFYGNLYYQDADGSHTINPVIEQGTKDVATVKSDQSFDKNVTWYYRKWADGSAECWCKRNVDVKVTTTWGSLFYGVTTTINYPFQFIENPICHITCEYGTDAVSLFIASSGTGTNVYATPIMLCRATSNANVNCNILYHAHGRWK